MCSTPLNRGFLSTSTPISPLSDSGYFSSSDKVPLDKVLHSLSPIKEISNSKRVTELVELTRFQFYESPSIRLDSYAIAKELNFSNSTDFVSDSFFDCSHEFDEDTSFPSFQIKDLLAEEDGLVIKNSSDRKHYGINFRQNIKLVNVCKRLNFSHANKTASFADTDCKKDNIVSLKTAFRLKNKINFFEEFERRNLYSITSFVLSLLSAEDLCEVSCVNKNWRETVQHDIHANSRRKAYLKEKYSQKENKYHSSTSDLKLKEKRHLHEECKTVLFNKCNFSTAKQPLKNQANTKFDSFVKEGKTQESSILMKCPKCKYAAKNQLGNAYLCTECDYVFCQRCLSPYFNGHTCSTSKKVSMVIGSKQCKRNLKRL